MPANTIFSTLTTPPIRLSNGKLDTRPDYRGGVAPGGGGGTTPVDPVGLIFSQDFDAMPDWAIEHEDQRYKWIGDTTDGGESNVPQGFDFYYSSEDWHPNGNINGLNAVAGNEPVAQINNRFGGLSGASGKSLIIFDESQGGSSTWGSDIILAKVLDAEYQELFTEQVVKFQDDWVWEAELYPDGQNFMKVLRMGTFRGGDTDNRFFFGTGSVVSPLCFVDLGEWVQNGGALQRARIKSAVRYNPYSDGLSTTVFADAAESSFAQYFLDSQFHKVAMYMKMNSAAGAADGVLKVWLDGILRIEDSAVEWNKVEADNGIGFNYVGIGGNASNTPYPEAQRHEQWWAIGSCNVYDSIPEAYL